MSSYLYTITTRRFYVTIISISLLLFKLLPGQKEYRLFRGIKNKYCIPKYRDVRFSREINFFTGYKCLFIDSIDLKTEVFEPPEFV